MPKASSLYSYIVDSTSCIASDAHDMIEVVFLGVFM